jgi:hypothetical protein
MNRLLDLGNKDPGTDSSSPELFRIFTLRARSVATALSEKLCKFWSGL